MREASDRGGSPIITILAFCVLAFLIAPQLILVVQSFTAEDYLSFPPVKFGMRWYIHALTDETWRQSFLTSLSIAALSTPLAVFVGTLLAVGIDRGPHRGRGLLRAFFVSPMVLPHVVLGFGLYRVFLSIALDDTLAGFVVAHLLLSIPFIVVTVGASLQTVDPTLEEAAQSLGASPLWAFVKVTLPSIFPGVLAGSIFAFITSFDEFIVTYFLASRQATIPIQIFGSLSYQIEPSIAAVSGLTLAVTTALSLLLVIKGRFGGEKGRNAA